MEYRLFIEVNGSKDIYDMMKDIVMQNPQTMRIVEDDTEKENIRFHDLEIDIKRRQVLVEGKKISLTTREFDILLFLVKNPGRVFSHCEIYEEVWGKRYVHDSANITSHIGHIRKKIECNSNGSRYIKTVHGVGYKFEK